MKNIVVGAGFVIQVPSPGMIVQIQPVDKY